MTANKEVCKIWKEAVMTYVKVLSQLSPGRAQENHKRFLNQDIWPLGQQLEQELSNMSKSSKHSTALFCLKELIFVLLTFT
jgi:hypothetical protein